MDNAPLVPVLPRTFDPGTHNNKMSHSDATSRLATPSMGGLSLLTPPTPDIQDVPNDSYSIKVNGTLHQDYSNGSSIASTPEADQPPYAELNPYHDTNIDNTTSLSPRAFGDDFALEHDVSHHNAKPNDPEGLLDNNADPTPPGLKSAESSDACDVYFLHHSPVEEPPAYSRSHGDVKPKAYPVMPPTSKASLFDSNEHMPSLIPSRPFAPSSPISESNFRDSRATDDDVPMSQPRETLQEPTVGTLPYHGQSHYDGKHTISFEGLTKSEAEHYLTTDYAKFDDYHSAYIPNVVQSIESFCFCQDELIANDWNDMQ
ncbi:hypothetical protein P692DRAFT_20822519 [Suillus brevipes Sb2]|nr:hypothetical protein P692DRAFT_20822519 [Suillus brevipes Sb2]